MGEKQQQLSGCLKLEKVFYLLQNTAPNSKAIDKLRAMHAMHRGWLALTVTESRSVQPYITTRNYTDCESPKMPI